VRVIRSLLGISLATVPLHSLPPGRGVQNLLAQAQKAPVVARQDASVASISSVEVEHSGQQTTVRITGSGELRYQAFRLSAPARLVLDFANTRFSVARYRVSSDYAPVLGVRMGHPVPERARVVIDLAQSSLFTSQTDGSSVAISFASPVARAASSAAPVLAPVDPPQMHLPGRLTGRDFAFARPADGLAAPAPLDPQVPEQETSATVPGLVQVASGQVVVAYLNGELTIRASNATLGDILQAVCEKMGAVLEIPSGAERRMFAILGPGRPREVLSSLLDNAQLDFVLVASANDPRALGRVMVFPENKGSGAGGSVPQSQVAQDVVAEKHESGQPDVNTPHGAPVAKDSTAQHRSRVIALLQAP